MGIMASTLDFGRNITMTNQSTILCESNSSVKTKYKIQEANSEFATMIYEIGSGSSYLGYSKNAGDLIAKE